MGAAAPSRTAVVRSDLPPQSIPQRSIIDHGIKSPPPQTNRCRRPRSISASSSRSSNRAWTQLIKRTGLASPHHPPDRSIIHPSIHPQASMTLVESPAPPAPATMLPSMAAAAPMRRSSSPTAVRRYVRGCCVVDVVLPSRLTVTHTPRSTTTHTRQVALAGRLAIAARPGPERQPPPRPPREQRQGERRPAL